MGSRSVFLTGIFELVISRNSTITANATVRWTAQDWRIADGDLNGDGIVTIADLDLAYVQFGLALDPIS